MLKRLIVLAFAAVLPATAGCLQHETSHTLYLSPDGSVEWVSLEANVRSDESEPGKRIAEEQAYLAGVWVGSHGVARGLAALRPQDVVETRALRDQRPFHVMTSAKFAAVDRVLAQVFREIGIETTATLVRGADENTLRIRLDFSRPYPGSDSEYPESDPRPGERDRPVFELLDNFEHLRVVLTDGQFKAADGFDVTDRTSATLSSEWIDSVQKAYETKSAVEFSLTWTAN